MSRGATAAAPERRMFRAMQRRAFEAPLTQASAPPEVMLSYFKRLGAEASIGLTLNK